MQTAPATVTETPLPARRPRKPSPSAAERMKREMIDEYGELNRQVQMFEPTQARFELVKKAIKSWFDDAPADAEASLEGKLYRLHVSACQRERRIRDMQKLALEVGHDDLLEILSRYVPLGVIEERIGREKTAALVVEGRTGSRRIRAVPKLPSRQTPPA